MTDIDAGKKFYCYTCKDFVGYSIKSLAKKHYKRDGTCYEKSYAGREVTCGECADPVVEFPREFTELVDARSSLHEVAIFAKKMITEIMDELGTHKSAEELNRYWMKKRQAFDEKVKNVENRLR